MSFHFYLKPQKYSSCYQAKITNLKESDNDIIVVLPIPQNTDYQTITNEIIFSSNPAEIKTDQRYKNKYAFWHFNLKPKETIQLKENFFVLVKPRKKQNIKNFMLCDYNKNQEYQLYTASNHFIKSETNEIKQLSRKIISKEENIAIIIKKINRYVIKSLKYGKPISGLYSSDDALKNDAIDCGGFSALFVAICATMGIPARIISGFWAGYKTNAMHAWAEVLLPNGQWLVIDSTIEQLRRLGRTKKFAKLGAVGSDRIVLSIGCNIPVEMNDKKYFAPILQNPFIMTSQGENSFQAQTNFITDIWRK